MQEEVLVALLAVPLYAAAATSYIPWVQSTDGTAVPAGVPLDGLGPGIFRPGYYHLSMVFMALTSLVASLRNSAVWLLATMVYFCWCMATVCTDAWKVNITFAVDMYMYALLLYATLLMLIVRGKALDPAVKHTLPEPRHTD
jgi:hypothetical protein